MFLTDTLNGRSLVRPIGRRRRQWGWQGGVLPLVHLFRIRQLGSCPLPTMTQPVLATLYLSLKDGQLNFLIIDLEDGCQYSARAPRITSTNLGTKLVDLNPVGTHPTIHDVFPTRKLHVPFLQTHVRGIISLNNLVQRDREFLPALLGVLPQLLDGREDNHGVLRSGLDIDHLGALSLLELVDPSLQIIVLESMFSFLANKETEHTNPVLFPSDHGPESIPQTGHVAHGTH